VSFSVVVRLNTGLLWCVVLAVGDEVAVALELEAAARAAPAPGPVPGTPVTTCLLLGLSTSGKSRPPASGLRLGEQAVVQAQFGRHRLVHATQVMVPLTFTASAPGVPLLVSGTTRGLHGGDAAVGVLLAAGALDHHSRTSAAPCCRIAGGKRRKKPLAGHFGMKSSRSIQTSGPG
jgi:hypothetical protein